MDGAELNCAVKKAVYKQRLIYFFYVLSPCSLRANPATDQGFYLRVKGHLSWLATSGIPEYSASSENLAKEKWTHFLKL